MKPGRNDLCPCGSGKKYKHCHMNLDQAPRPEDMTWRRLQRVTEDLADRLITAATTHFGPAGIQEAWQEFNLWDEDETEFNPGTPHLQVFGPWFLYNWLPDPEETEVPPQAQTLTAAQHYLRSAGDRLDPLARRYVEACIAGAFSFHEILSCEPGRGFRLRDVLLGSESDVIERSGSAEAEVGTLLFAKVVPIDGIAVLDGCTPVRIPPKCKPEIIQLRAELAQEGEPLTVDVLRELDLDLIELYLALADDLLNPRLPALANTDGDPLEFQELVYDLDSPAAAFNALKALAVGMADEEVMQGAVFNAAGALVSAEIPWRKAGNAMHSTWQNTALGTLKIEGKRLTAEVNSARRAQELRVHIEKLVGAQARYRTTVVQSVQSMLGRKQTPQEQEAARRTREESARLAALPEVKAAMAEMLRAHYRKWLDQNIPALGDRTPREAMRDADGREAVEALVLQIERDGAHLQPPVDPDIVRELRESLGLGKPT